jgi:hypothetical protein
VPVLWAGDWLPAPEQAEQSGPADPHPQLRIGRPAFLDAKTNMLDGHWPTYCTSQKSVVVPMRRTTAVFSMGSFTLGSNPVSHAPTACAIGKPPNRQPTVRHQAATLHFSPSCRPCLKLSNMGSQSTMSHRDLSQTSALLLEKDAK